ncbi:MAG: hypothetical protein ABI216_22220 [Devosia sp.]
MKTSHFTIYGKGGAGKTFIASMLFQYLKARDLPTERFYLGGSGNYDDCFNRVLEEDMNFVIDNARMVFHDLDYYVSENNVFEIIQEHAKRSVVHIPITNNRESVDHFLLTLSGLPPYVDVVVWLNGYHGNADEFMKSVAYIENKDRILSVVRLDEYPHPVYDTDLQMMLKEGMSFDEAAASPSFTLMANSRLIKVRGNIFSQLDAIL